MVADSEVAMEAVPVAAMEAEREAMVVEVEEVTAVAREVATK